MPTNQLNISANQRVDLEDFRYAVNDSLQTQQRQTVGQFFTDPAKTRTFIIDGFKATNPSGNQVQVTKGRAILMERDDAVVVDGVLSSEGDTSRIIDVSGFADGTYSVWIRFNYVESDSASRTFWDPSGSGSEFSQVTSTRLSANWSMRIELTTPGSEWVAVATVAVTSGNISSGPTDTRNLYFEGSVPDSYESGWSSDGGGVANDRNSDREQYGVKDLQTFTAAMRQCLTDIKGRGLRAWYARDIGGMNIGFDADPVEDTLAVGDANFALDFNSGDPQITFESNSWMRMVRGDDDLFVRLNGVDEFQLGNLGAWFGNAVGVGIALGTALTNDTVVVGDTSFFMQWDGTDPNITFDSNDSLFYDRSVNQYEFRVGSTAQVRINTSAMLPDASSSLDLGSIGAPWNDVHGRRLFLSDDSGFSWAKTAEQGGLEQDIPSSGTWHIAYSDVITHGITAELPNNAFFRATIDPDGSPRFLSIGEDEVGVRYEGCAVSTDATTGTGANGPIVLAGWTKASTNLSSVGTNNLLVVRDGADACFIIKGNGDVHLDGSTNDASFDDQQDALACRDAMYAFAGQHDRIMSYTMDKLEEIGVAKNGFYWVQGLTSLMLGGIGEIYHVLDWLLQKNGTSYEDVRQIIRGGATA